MNLREKFQVAAGSKVKLKDHNTADTDDIKDKEIGKARTAKNLARIAELQEQLYVEHKQSLLIVLQAMDAGGKDGAIETLAGAMNPLGVKVVSFKAPSKEEIDHDYLWRVHAKAPAKGDVAVFNRSHYEEVLIARVNSLVPEETWKKRYGQINGFEDLLTENGTKVIKFFLHISKDEQLERLQARVEDPAKNWKFNEADMAERTKWDAYMEAFEDLLSKCSTEKAPWIVVPSDKKWFRDLVISEVVLDCLEKMAPKLPEPSFDRTEMRAKYFAGAANDAGKDAASQKPKKKTPKPDRS